MQVTKSNGKKEDFDLQKIRTVVDWACEGTGLNPLKLEANISSVFKDNIKTSDIQETVINSSNQLVSVDEPKWAIVSGRLHLMNIHKKALSNFKIKYTMSMIEYIKFMISKGKYENIFEWYTEEEIEKAQSLIKPDRDYDYTIAGAIALDKKYLVKIQGKHAELPQFMYIMISLLQNKNETSYRMRKVKQTYDEVSQRNISLATPQLSGLRVPGSSLSSCFIGETEDSLDSLMRSFTHMANISKRGGGIGWYFGKVRPSNSWVGDTPEVSNHVNLWIKMANDVAVAVNQNGKRKGAITIGLDFWHKDIEGFMEMGSENGDQRLKSHDIFPQLIISNWFVKALQEDREYWLVDRYEIQKHFWELEQLENKVSLFDYEENDLTELHNEGFDKLFDTVQELYENGTLTNGIKVKAKNIWKEALKTWMETGKFYVVNKDNINVMNPLKDYGTIKQGNLCLVEDTEIDIKVQGKDLRVQIQDVGVYFKEEYRVFVKSYNTEGKYNEYKECYEFLDMGMSETLYEIQDEDGNVIECTGDHKVYTQNRGYVEAKELTENDTLVTQAYSTSIASITIKEESRKIYDINVKDNHNFFANDILVHNCVESFSITKPDTLTHVCNLLSLNMTEILNSQVKLENAVRMSIRMLDNALDLTTVPLESGTKHNNELRTVGLGTTGIADWVAHNKLSYEKDEDVDQIVDLYEQIAYYAIDESINLAEERGTFPLYEHSEYAKGIILNKTAKQMKKRSKLDWNPIYEKLAKHGIRNAHLLMLAPNTSSSLVQGSSASYLPVMSKFFYEQNGDMMVPNVPKFIDSKFWYYKENKNMNQKYIMRLTSRMQEWIDTGISMEINLNVDLFPSIKDFSDSLVEFFTSGGKALYYGRIHDSTTKDEAKEEVCVSCAN